MHFTFAETIKGDTLAQFQPTQDPGNAMAQEQPRSPTDSQLVNAVGKY